MSQESSVSGVALGLGDNLKQNQVEAILPGPAAPELSPHSEEAVSTSASSFSGLT